MKVAQQLSRSFIEKLIQDETLRFDLDLRQSDLCIDAESLFKIVEACYLKGQEEAYYWGVDDGRDEGLEEGYDNGYRDAEDELSDDFYNDGYDDGYDRGYKSGVEDTEERYRKAEIERDSKN